MAIAYEIVKKGVAGNLRVNIVDITLDGSYAAGGYALDPASMGVGRVHAVQPTVSTVVGVLPVYDVANGKLVLYKGANTVTVTSGNAAFTQLANNDTIISASHKVRCVVFGDAVHG